MDAIQKRQEFIVTYGKVFYVSVFGTRHWIHMCRLGPAGAPIIDPVAEAWSDKLHGICARYNEIDPTTEDYDHDPSENPT